MRCSGTIFVLVEDTEFFAYW